MWDGVVILDVGVCCYEFFCCFGVGREMPFEHVFLVVFVDGLYEVVEAFEVVGSSYESDFVWFYEFAWMEVESFWIDKVIDSDDFVWVDMVVFNDVQSDMSCDCGDDV